jgi:regulator of ribonuclease activity A
MIALGTSPKKSAKDNLGTVNLTVRFADVDFAPGEFVYVDEDGIVVSSTELALP